MTDAIAVADEMTEVAELRVGPNSLEAAILDAVPPNGRWSEEDYLWLTNRTNRLIEYSDGRLELLPMPTDRHQAILDCLLRLLWAWLDPTGGRARSAGLRVR